MAVKKDSRLTENQQRGVINFYKVLAPNAAERDIDIPMIVDKAFPAFEETIGNEEFSKVKAYYGIEDKNKKKLNINQISVLVSKLRTIENARYYISGYEEMLERVARKLEGAPENMPMIVKAKLVRMMAILFFNGHFFPDEYRAGNNVTFVDAIKVNKKNQMIVYPEDLSIFYTSNLLRFENETLMFDFIIYELVRLDNRLCEEVLNFSELKYLKDNDVAFISINKASKALKYSDVRNLKARINPIPASIHLEQLANKTEMEKMSFEHLYQVYKALANKPLHYFLTEVRKIVMVKNMKPVVAEMKCPVIYDKCVVSSEIEANRIIFVFENFARRGLTMKAQAELKDGEICLFDCPIGVYLAAIRFAIEVGYENLTPQSTAERDFQVANMLIEKAEVEDWIKYLNGEFSTDEIRNIVGIKQKETPLEAVMRLANTWGYSSEKNESLKELVEEVILPGNESAIEKFVNGEINESVLKKKIGFEDEFGPMYFDYRKIDIPVIENKLQEMKRSMATDLKKSALLVNLYCHVIEGQKKCGPKMKVPKGNKGLKPQNLRARIS